MAYSEQTGPPWNTLPTDPLTHTDEITYDGDGRAVKIRSVNDIDRYDSPWYYIYSSVTGQKITDIINDYRVATHVYMGGSMIAEEYGDDNEEDFAVFNLTDPVTGSVRKINPDGTIGPDNDDGGIYPSRTEMAGLGTTVPLTAPQAYPLPPRRGGYAGDAEMGCIIDGMGLSTGACTRLIGESSRVIVVRKSWKRHRFNLDGLSPWADVRGGNP